MYQPPAGSQWERPNSINIGPLSPEASGHFGRIILSSALASAVYPSANLAICYPFTIAQPYTVRSMWWVNGTANSGNINAGIYSAPESGSSTIDRVVTTGSTAQAGSANAPQNAAVSITLQPGRYYMVLCCDNTTATFLGKVPAVAMTAAIIGYAQVASAFALGTTLALAPYTTLYWPMFGCSQKTGGI